MSPRTSDLCDTHEAVLRFCHMAFRLFGRQREFSGPIATVKCFEDNVLVREKLSEPGEGRVLVVDAGGSTRCAVVGDMIAELGRKNGWSGLIINGAVRDSVALVAMDFSVMALGTSPIRSAKSRTGTIDVAVRFGDAEFVPGEYLYADDDGVLVSAEKLD